jgi:hypothetical protein
MGKSKYPNKLDTSIEIPAVRDNIVEVGSDVLNSLRSAIFNIERTLGVNPQGATGNTVASRVNRALDGNGNILKEALDKAGLISGPITDADVSKAAGIDESKLKLEYPTTLLQDEISQLIQQIENISTTLEELSYLYAAHTHYEAKNRHKGNAIAIDAIDRVLSSTGMVSSERQTAQELFEAIFSSHINYDGSDISESNRSHEASQLFFDKTEVSAHVISEDVQGAIIDVLRAMLGQVTDHQNRHHSNGALRTSVITGTEDISAGRMLLDEQEVIYSPYEWATETTKLSTVTFPDEPLVPSESIERSDILRLYSEIDEEYSDYQIHSIGYSNEGTTILFIKIFGTLSRNSLPTDRAKIFRNKNARTSPASLLASARLYPAPGPLVNTNIDLIQIANPSSSTIISKGIRPSEISLNNRYMRIVIDGDEENDIKLDVHDGMGPSGQTIDSIINKMNIKFAKEAASVLAYRVDYDDLHSPEIALVHSLPSTLTQPFTLSVSRSQDDGIDSLGFGHVEDEVIDQGSGSEYYIRGEKYSNLGIKLEQTGLTLMGGTSNVQSIVAGINFEDYEVMVGDLLVVTNTVDDDGTYVIEHVTQNMLEIDSDQLLGGTWNGEASQEAIFYILKSTVSLRNFEFYKPVGGVGKGAVVDIFLNKDREIFYNTRLEYSIETYIASNSLISPCDFDGDVSLYAKDSEGIITASLTAGGAPRLSLDGGIPVEVSGLKSKYINLKSGLHNITIKAFIEDADQIKNKIANEGDFSIELHGDSDINLEENLLIARVLYDSKHSRITGAGPGSDGLLPRIFKKLESGITSDKDLSSKALKRVYQGPISETRSNGVTEGLKLTPAAEPMLAAPPNEYVVNISGGACYVKGKKFVFDKYTDLISDVGAGDFDKVFIAINEWGELVFAGAGAAGGPGEACACPFSADSHCILSVIEWDKVNTPVAIDLRLFLNDLDLKVLNAVTVSPQHGMGHFTEFGEALKYAKRFGDLFPKAGIPTVHLKSGTHKVVVDTGVTTGAYTLASHNQAASYYGSWINFPVNITGEGYSTVLDIMKIFSNAGEEADDRTEAGDPTHDGFLMIAGPGLQSTPNGNGGVLDNGFVTLSNLRLKDCSVIIYDPWIKDKNGNKLNWGVRIDGVIFDRTEKVDFSRHSAGVWFHSIDSDGSELIGNLSMSNCQSLNAPALLSSDADCPASAHRNISFINNTFRGTGDGVIDGADYMVYNEGAGNIFELADAPLENNIEYRGNINADSEQDAGTWIDSGNSNMWGDRISRDLSVGGRLGVGVSPGVIYSLEVAPSSGFNKGARLQGDSLVQGDFLVEGDFTVTAGSLTVDGGDLAMEGGNLNFSTGSINVADGELSLTGGDLSVADGSIDAYNGQIWTRDLFLEDSESMIRMTSTSTTPATSSTIWLRRVSADMDEGHRLGEVWFSGSETGDPAQGGSTIAGAGIVAEVDVGHTEDEFPTRLDFYTKQAMQNIAKGMRLTPKGALRVVGGDPVSLGGPTGILQVGGDVDGDGKHIAIDGTRIQAKAAAFGTMTDTLNLNPWGGAVHIGGPISSPPPGAWTYIEDHLSVTGDIVATGYIGAEFLSINAGTSAGSGGAHFTGNSGYSNESPAGINNIGSVVTIYDYQADGHDGSALNIHLRNLSDGVDFEDGNPTTEGADWFIGFWDDSGSAVGQITREGGSMVYGGFTGGHITPVDDNELHDLKTPGLIVSSNGIAMTDRSLSEPYVGTMLSRKEKDKSVLGIICTGPRLYDEGLKLANWKEGVHGITVNSVGNGRVWVTNIAGDIENGDFICSSNIPGYGQMQDDDLMHNYTAAKATEAVDWDNVTDTITHEGVTYKKFLIACSYHCG